MKKLLKSLEKCYTYRDLYHLEEQFLENGLALTTTNNGTRVLCAIRDGQVQGRQMFQDFIFIDQPDQNVLESRQLEIIKNFVQENASNEKLALEPKSYHKKYSLYGPAFSFNEEKRLLGEQTIRYISRLIED
jgi:hypothetical protein